MISQRVQRVLPSATLALSAKAKALQAEGKDVLNFTAGEPDFPVAEHIRKAACAAIEQNDSYYSPTEGIRELREAIAQKFFVEKGVQREIANVCVTNGGKEALFLLFQVLLNDGDEVILPAPYWVSYAEQIRYAGGVPIYLQTDDTFHFTAADIETHITPRTKILLLNNPSNPTGAVLQADELERIAHIVQKHELFVVSDEVYEQFVYDGQRQQSIAAYMGTDERMIIVNAISKTYCMTGWRLGYAIASKEIIQAMALLKGHLSSNTNNIAQRAAVAALTGPQEHVELMRQEFERRRNVLWEGINAIPGCSLVKPEGAFFGFINMAEVMQQKNIPDSFTLCDRLLYEQLVAVVPGVAFGEGYDTFVRFSFSIDSDIIRRAIERIRDF